MDKIMFNDEYSLTQAVLDKRKNNTRRIIKLKAGEYVRVVALENGSFMSYVAKDGEPTAYADGNVEMPNFVRILKPKYFIGQEVAIAQSYRTLANEKGKEGEFLFKKYYPKFGLWSNKPGWSNKMFVEAGLMLHRIKITNIRVERLQDITDEDCIKEGIYKSDPLPHAIDGYKFIGYSYDASADPKKRKWWYHTPREAFAVLIEKVSGKGTWESNPYVFVYEFELIK